jgi:DNA recombination protein RmuC
MNIETILILAVLALLAWLLFLNLRGAKGPVLKGYLESLSKDQERLEKTLKDEMARNREETNANERAAREELNRQFSALAQVSEQKLESLRVTLERQLRLLQEDNGQKLDQMRHVVDEKLQATLEKRLNDSFRMVSERLEQVHQGLGEMQSLAANVGALQRTLTNVKTRGTWGEVQLESLLKEILTSEQYEKNVATKKGSRDRVEFAIKLPGRETSEGECVWLPIDAKFPQEDHQRLVEAFEKGDTAAVEEATRSLTVRIKTEARNIKEKYLDPPYTTDFGILFLPTESLYAEVLRQPGLLDQVQRESRMIITGPTTLAAILNSLQIGFRTLTIEKRSSEVWTLLGLVKKEFATFAGILEKTQKKLQEASNTIDDAAKKTRTIEQKLRKVEGIPERTSEALPEESGVELPLE